MSIDREFSHSETNTKVSLHSPRIDGVWVFVCVCVWVGGCEFVCVCECVYVGCVCVWGVCVRVCVKERER